MNEAITKHIDYETTPPVMLYTPCARVVGLTLPWRTLWSPIASSPVYTALCQGRAPCCPTIRPTPRGVYTSYPFSVSASQASTPTTARSVWWVMTGRCGVSDRVDQFVCSWVKSVCQYYATL